MIKTHHHRSFLVQCTCLVGLLSLSLPNYAQNKTVKPTPISPRPPARTTPKPPSRPATPTVKAPPTPVDPTRTIPGTVMVSTKQNTDAQFIRVLTRFYPIGNPELQNLALVSNLKNKGFELSATGYKRTRISGVERTFDTTGYTVGGDPEIHGRVTANIWVFGTATPRLEGVKFIGADGVGVLQTHVDAVTEIVREREQTGWIYSFGVPYPIYDDVSHVVEAKPAKMVNSIDTNVQAPTFPITLPSQISVGYTLGFKIDGVPDVMVQWRVTRLYTRGNLTFAEGDLVSADTTVVKVAGSMTLGTDDGVIEKLNAKIDYPRGEWDDMSTGAWTLTADWTRVSKATADLLREKEERRYEQMTTTSALWASDIAEERIPISSWTMKNTKWKVQFDTQHNFVASQGTQSVWGSWQLMDRAIEMKVSSTGTGKESRLAFFLPTHTLESKVDPQNPAEFFESK